MKTNPISDAKVFGYWAYLAIEKHFQKTIKHETDVLKDKDPEALHQMRVGMRRLRTAIASFDGAIALPKVARPDRIGKIARKLGKLRDLDVLLDTLENQYLPDLPATEQKTLKKVLATLHKQRQHSLETVQITLHAKSYQELKQGLQDWLEEPKYGIFAQLAILDILPNLLLPLTSQLFLHPAWLVGVKIQNGEIEMNLDMTPESVMEILSAPDEDLHDLRKEAKGVRYQMELFTDFYHPNYQNYLKDIKSIQSILGQIQDSFVLADFLRDLIEEDLASELPILATKLSSSRYKLWQEWQKIQECYLKPQTQKELHQLILNPKLKNSEN
ncbi:MAG TPA: metal-binding protein [Cyanobacteria bacterium UBA11149]|nr:metal-binding protein [Cyanobacteria bacterium UBA11367]HBE59924.1 metal-binding protein [Cyanobacteria bacterium UBA11366]HBK64694.1 metal-binding protein [Cyanobacteria bacterium UBA11166]HBR75880.1 metal-binding protein [Cyanobacteria bacterium UBA11159]HBS69302.1 metal-binding protein [Cyanobacteria bacterium UBA11153]HBW89722.1 metal-binding protein [Cyanobacteria bacterium UBA11149]HCA93875.1 metal-binding protein [Cyanobacteria bacterium UBA9226]